MGTRSWLRMQSEDNTVWSRYRPYRAPTRELVHALTLARATVSAHCPRDGVLLKVSCCCECVPASSVQAGSGSAVLCPGSTHSPA